MNETEPTEQKPCPRCGRPREEDWPGICFHCHRVRSGLAVRTSPRARRWFACAEFGRPYYATLLLTLARALHARAQKEDEYADEPDSALLKAIEATLGTELTGGRATGQKILKAVWGLLAFAWREMEAHGFAAEPLFVLGRLERHFAKQTAVLDFWLTLCRAYDLSSYLPHLPA